MTTWLARAEAWLLEPAGPRASTAAASEPGPPPARPVVAVVGLARGCGATTVARALAVELAGRDPAGAAIVVSARLTVGPLPVASAAAARLARSLRALGGSGVRSCGRVCLTRHPALDSIRRAPVVLDTGRDGSSAGIADRTLLVAGPRVEPSLALVVASSFERSGRPPALVANRVEDAERWAAIGALVTGESRLAAGLALAGREPRGRLGAAMRDLVDRWEAEGREGEGR